MKSQKSKNEFEIENVCMLHPKTITKKGYENSPCKTYELECNETSPRERLT